MQPNGMIFWDWNGTLMDDVDFTHECLNWMLETHGYPQRYDLAAYRELFGFPIEDYYRCARSTVPPSWVLPSTKKASSPRPQTVWPLPAASPRQRWQRASPGRISTSTALP